MDILIGMRNSFFNNVDPRRQQERRDFRMVQEDHTKMANLPSQGWQREIQREGLLKEKIIIGEW